MDFIGSQHWQMQNVWYGGVMILVVLLFIFAAIVFSAACLFGNSSLYLHGDITNSRRSEVEW